MGMHDFLRSGLEVFVVCTWFAIVFFVFRARAAIEETTAGDFLQGLRGKSRDAMVLGAGVMCLVDRHRGVHDLRSNCLFVDDGLHGFVDVVMGMLAFDSGSCAGGVPGFVGGGGVSELAGFLLESGSSGISVFVFELLLHHGLHLMAVLFREDLLVLDWLDGGVVVVLMDLAVDGFLRLFVECRLDTLLSYWSRYRFLNGRVMVAMLRSEV